MKTLTKTLAAVLIAIFITNLSFAEKAKYSLSVANINFTTANSLEFEIHLLNTSRSELKYLSGQYFLNFNPEIANGGSLTYSIVNSDLPEAFRSARSIVSGNQLRMSCNFISIDNKTLPVVSTVSPGTLVAKMKLETSSDKFASVSPELKWSENKNSFTTKIYILENNIGTNITNSQNHFSNSSEIVNDNGEINGLPSEFSLSQNYPNPFNPVTKIKFDIPSFVNGGVNVKLIVYNIAGKEVATLVNEKMDAGSHEIKFEAKSLSSGIYFYKITAGDYSKTMRMVLIK